MLRRFIAVVGILALAVSYVPAAIGGAYASTMPDCCNGIMCPMHHMAGDQEVCGMGAEQSSGASLQSCPDNAQRYTAALSFVPIAPSTFFAERVVATASAYTVPLLLNADLGIVLPPPRTALA